MKEIFDDNSDCSFLKDWKIQSVPSGLCFLEGNIYYDCYNRFEDGTYISTSMIEDIIHIESDESSNIIFRVETKYSVYLCNQKDISSDTTLDYINSLILEKFTNKNN